MESRYSRHSSRLQRTSKRRIIMKKILLMDNSSHPRSFLINLIFKADLDNEVKAYKIKEFVTLVFGIVACTTAALQFAGINPRGSFWHEQGLLASLVLLATMCAEWLLAKLVRRRTKKLFMTSFLQSADPTSSLEESPGFLGKK